ncbi:hypothetical protein [Kitasatospora sp. NPDC098663]|uniref:hypothetical protein n=1 Tax=Kitasatospora sp. NPDC098663 TaxID=3364096 RepID=UPI00382ABCD2
MGLLSRLGLGSSTPASKASATTTTRTSGMSTTGWHAPYDEATARRHHQIAQVKTFEPGDGDGDHIVRNFGRPYRQDGGAQ